MASNRKWLRLQQLEWVYDGVLLAESSVVFFGSASSKVQGHDLARAASLSVQRQAEAVLS